VRDRTLLWDGCLNVRDLGGMPTASGGETRFGAVVRADSVRQLSDAGWNALVDYGVRTVVDLRGEHERASDPPRELPVEVVHAPFMEANKTEWETLRPHVDDAFNGAADAVAGIRDVYLLFLERFPQHAAAAVRAVAEAPTGGVVIHCVGGKDRTGLVAALLLRLAGVGHEAIGADYALSEANLRAFNEAWIAKAEDDLERERRRRRGEAPAAAMVEVVCELERRYGSVRGYLRAAGVEAEALDRVTTRLVE
jgi:protein tyrosine/serine phosphatase